MLVVMPGLKKVDPTSTPQRTAWLCTLSNVQECADWRLLPRCSLGANFQHDSNTKSNSAHNKGGGKSNVSICVRHVNRAGMEESVCSHANNTKKEAQPHASGGKQQRGK